VERGLALAYTIIALANAMRASRLLSSAVPQYCRTLSSASVRR